MTPLRPACTRCVGLGWPRHLCEQPAALTPPAFVVLWRFGPILGSPWSCGTCPSWPAGVSVSGEVIAPISTARCRCMALSPAYANGPNACGGSKPSTSLTRFCSAWTSSRSRWGSLNRPHRCFTQRLWCEGHPGLCLECHALRLDFKLPQVATFSGSSLDAGPWLQAAADSH